jgi:hypothetical protein
MARRRSSRRRRRSRQPTRWAAAALLLALGLAAIYWHLWRGDEGPAQPTARQPSQEVG